MKDLLMSKFKDREIITYNDVVERLSFDFDKKDLFLSTLGCISIKKYTVLKTENELIFADDYIFGYDTLVSVRFNSEGIASITSSELEKSNLCTEGNSLISTFKAGEVITYTELIRRLYGRLTNVSNKDILFDLPKLIHQDTLEVHLGIDEIVVTSNPPSDFALFIEVDGFEVKSVSLYVLEDGELTDDDIDYELNKR